MGAGDCVAAEEEQERHAPPGSGPDLATQVCI